MEISARLSYDCLAQGTVHNPHLVVSLKAPTLDWLEKRPHLCVLPVIDLSGSMGGAKLNYAKQSLLKLVDQLKDGDLTGLVGFESRVHVLFKPQVVTSEVKAKLKHVITGLRVMGGTNFTDGMLKAIEVVQGLDLPAKFLKRIIMFTDGEPTEGVVDKKKIFSLLKKARGNVTISAFGYGSGGGAYGGCDQEFLTDFAGLASGNYAYVENPDGALAAFGKELGGLLSTYATDMTLTVEPTEGNAVKKVVTDVSFEEDIVKIVTIHVSEILSEETRHFVFETTIGAHRALPRELPVFEVKLSYSVLTEDGKKEVKEVTTRARVRFVREADAQKEPHESVMAVVNLQRLVRTQLDAEALAKKGQYQQAQAVMTHFAGEMHTSGGVVGNRLYDAATTAARYLSTPSSYNSNQGYLRSVASGGTRAYGTSSMHEDAASILFDCNVSVSNESMVDMVEEFTSQPVVAATNIVFTAQPVTNIGVITDAYEAALLPDSDKSG